MRGIFDRTEINGMVMRATWCKTRTCCMDRGFFLNSGRRARVFMIKG
jgi:hypothetical protein